MKPLRFMLHVLAFALLLEGCVVYHYTFLVLQPLVAGVPQALARAYLDVIGLNHLDDDLRLVHTSAQAVLGSCGYHGDCRLLTSSWQHLPSEGLLEGLAGIEEAFSGSLAEVGRLCGDRYLGSEGLAPFAARLDAIASETSAIHNRLSEADCDEIVPRFCTVRLDVGWLVEQAPGVHWAAQRVLHSPTMNLLQAVIPHLTYAHLVPWVLAVVALYYLNCWPLELVFCCSFGGWPLKLWVTTVHLLLWLVLFFGLSATSVVGVEVMLNLGVVKLPMMPGAPLLSEVSRHLRSEFPEFWSELFGEAREKGFLSYEPELLVSALLALEVACLIVGIDGAMTWLRLQRNKWRRPVTCMDLERDILSKDAWPDAPESELQELRELMQCQREALAHVRARCRTLHTAALPHLRRRVQKLGFSFDDLARLLAWVRERAPIIVHVDLERYGWALAADTHYRNQFETSTSGGALSKRKREVWEDELFGNAYRNAAPFERCKYGVLNVINDPQGVRACRQYGGSYLLLRGVRLRTTLAATDSAGMDTDHLATVDYYAHVLNRYTDQELRHALQVGAGKSLGTDSRVLSTYKEAQVHGEVRLNTHVELIMAHPSMRVSSSACEALKALAARCKMPAPVWIEGGIDIGGDVEAAVRESLRDLAASPGIKVGSTVIINGRLAQVCWDGCPHDNFVKVKWQDDRHESHYVQVSEITLVEPPPPEEAWEVEVDGVWHALGPVAEAAIRRARSEGRAVARFDARGFIYSFDLVYGIQMNVATGRCRQGRRVAPQSQCGSGSRPAATPAATAPPSAASLAPVPLAD